VAGSVSTERASPLTRSVIFIPVSLGFSDYAYMMIVSAGIMGNRHGLVDTPQFAESLAVTYCGS